VPQLCYKTVGGSRKHGVQYEPSETKSDIHRDLFPQINAARVDRSTETAQKRLRWHHR
jgi:hypothetical protein